jgi:predicted transcriptional regulator
MYSLPQEIEVWYIIPKIRKELSDRLVNKHGFSYEKTGKILGITKAAVSQYLKNARANKIKLSKEMQAEVTKSAERIVDNNATGLAEIQNLLKIMKETKCSCNVCKQYNAGIIDYCKCKPDY